MAFEVPAQKAGLMNDGLPRFMRLIGGLDEQKLDRKLASTCNVVEQNEKHKNNVAVEPCL